MKFAIFVIVAALAVSAKASPLALGKEAGCDDTTNEDQQQLATGSQDVSQEGCGGSAGEGEGPSNFGSSDKKSSKSSDTSKASQSSEETIEKSAKSSSFNMNKSSSATSADSAATDTFDTSNDSSTDAVDETSLDTANDSCA